LLHRQTRGVPRSLRLQPRRLRQSPILPGGQPRATLVALSQTSMESIVGVSIEGPHSKLPQSTAFVESQASGAGARPCLIIDHEGRDGTFERHGGQPTRELHRVFTEPDGTTRSGGPASELFAFPLNRDAS
jgi:hypothetical protein